MADRRSVILKCVFGRSEGGAGGVLFALEVEAVEEEGREEANALEV